ncbi:hypothetical protein [Allobranchiibius sp. CTAmp26]|uniref:hypothetical protein n=1 Tax=Allobranchiibius sp. CTAmp26 TaxID=2815214 RepID=UPI001AA1BBD3|nr:hypothetical protein [Allobranchiibius sp. CTAmp26]MBO1756670.1 hypothetical protein [Allobranchiibius sp. CTAmp26]
MFFGWWVVAAIVHPSSDEILRGLIGLVFLTKVVLDEARGIVVDRVGVRRPLQRVIRWETVEGVYTGDVWLSLRCTDRNYKHARLPTRYAADVARVGDKPLETHFSPKPSQPLRRQEIRATWQQEQDAFATRSERVRARNAELLGDTETGEAGQVSKAPDLHEPRAGE